MAEPVARLCLARCDASRPIDGQPRQARAAAAEAQRHRRRRRRLRPAELWRVAGLYGRRIATDFDSFPFELVDLDSYWLAGARFAYRVDRRGRAVRPRRQCVRRRLSGRGRLSHRREERLCRASRRSSLASAAALQGRVAQPVHRRAAAAARRAGADRLGHPPRAAAGGNAAVARRRGAIRRNDGSLLSVVGLRPDLVLTMGGGARDRVRIAQRLGIRDRSTCPSRRAIDDVETVGCDGRRSRSAAGGGRGAGCADRGAASGPSRAAAATRSGSAAAGAACRRPGSRRNGWRWPGFASARCTATGSRSSNCWSRPPAILLRSDYRSGQYSGEQRWLTHPLAQRHATVADDRHRRAAPGPAWAR